MLLECCCTAILSFCPPWPCSVPVQYSHVLLPEVVLENRILYSMAFGTVLAMQPPSQGGLFFGCVLIRVGGYCPYEQPWKHFLNYFDIVIILTIHDTIFSVMLFSKIQIAACIMMYIVSFSYEPKYHSLLIQPNFFVLVIYRHQCLYLIHEKLQRSLYDFSL